MFRGMVVLSSVVTAATVASFGAAFGQDPRPTDQIMADSDRRFRHIIDHDERLHIYRLHQNSALYRACDKRRIGVLECSVEEISRIEQGRALGTGRAKALPKLTQPKTVTLARRAAEVPEPLPEVPTVPRPNTATITPFLRHDMPDISLFSQMKRAKDATGAEISYTRNRVADNDIWAVEGIAGFAYQLFGDYGQEGGPPRIMAAFLAPYVLVDKVFNSSAAQSASNSDTVSVGLKAEVGIDNLLGGQQYFRLGGATVFDNLGDTRSVSLTAEWIPVYDRLIHHPGVIPGTPILYRFDPELIAQFDSTTDDAKPLLFSGKDQALRIGPQFSLFLKPLPRTLGILSDFHANLTYHWAYEAYSGRSLSWFQSALTYNLDPNGHVAISATYKKGSDENTGKQVDVAKLALSGKI